MIEVLQQHDPASKALVDANTGLVVNYHELLRRVEQAAIQIQQISGRSLIFLDATNSVDSIVLYLAGLHLGYPMCLLDPHLRTEFRARLIEVYQPPILMLSPQNESPAAYLHAGCIRATNYQLILAERDSTALDSLHPDLALLLTTSGATGNPKLVRLQKRNLLSNALAIGDYLRLTPDECGIQSLPMHYSYGLSLINSHLIVGGTIVLTSHSFSRREFWHDFAFHGCTSFAGVPFMYENLHRLGFNPARYPSLQTMTQAGGPLSPHLIEQFRKRSVCTGVRFFVMYGQTEATARISYVPPQHLAEKIGSIGIAVPGGRIELRSIDAKHEQQELVYRGPNVMMGYATSARSLSLGDEYGGILHTGDLARVDDDGYYYLEGRLKRFAKLFGHRVNLYDIESDLERTFPLRAVVLDRKDNLVAYVQSTEDLDVTAIHRHIARQLDVPARVISVQRIDAIPMTSSGKKDYHAMRSQYA